MNHLYIFLLRAIPGGRPTIKKKRTFRPNGGPLTVVGLAVLLVGTAYLLDYFRKRNIG